MQRTPTYTEFRRSINGWLGEDTKGNLVRINVDQVIDYLLFRNQKNEIAIEEAGFEMCVCCEGWMKRGVLRTSIEIKPNQWLHVNCVGEFLKGHDPEAYGDPDYDGMAERFGNWFMRAPKKPEVMQAHQILKSHFQHVYEDVLKKISARH